MQQVRFLAKSCFKFMMDIILSFDYLLLYCLVIRWFAKNKDDGLIERELFPSFSGGVNWKLTIVTGEERGAGTDADVSVEIMGEDLMDLCGSYSGCI